VVFVKQKAYVAAAVPPRRKDVHWQHLIKKRCGFSVGVEVVIIVIVDVIEKVP
jgi:hypothetical protein